MKKRWLFPESPSQDEVVKLAEDINISKELSSILIQRGINTFEDSLDFFRPPLEKLHDPLLMKDMDVAVERLAKAIIENQHIRIYGDYDVDGTTSVALVMGFLSRHHENISYYVNDRTSEGYGISTTGIEMAARDKVDLIITLDCGIKAGRFVDLAAEKGIDFIICDHHTTGDTLPNAIAVLDPKREDCEYPFKELSGCGVGFKLMQGIAKRMEWDVMVLFARLDLLAISIAADIVPITGENRILCYHGMKALNSDSLPGINALKDLSKQAVIGINGIVFGLAPRINAAGRMSHANLAVDLLLSKDKAEVEKIAEEVNENNTTRRSFDKNITEEALSIIESYGDNKKSNVVYKKDWHQGVLGIVASRCIEEYHRPTIVLTGSNGSATGSARSVPGYNIYEAILQCEDLLEKFGGHKFAAGLTLSLENLDDFVQRFEKVVSETITDELLIPPLELDSEIDFDSISMNFVSILEQMEPFGPGNSAPVFYSEDLFLSRPAQLIKEKHVKFTVGQKGKLKVFEAIGFGMKDYFEKLNVENSFKMAFCVERNNFMGENKVQLRIKDIEFK